VLQIAQVLSAIRSAQADLLRRAMARRSEEMEAQRADFVSGAVERESTVARPKRSRAVGALCRLRLQQKPRRRLMRSVTTRPAYLKARIRRVPRRSMTLSMGQHRQARGIRTELPASASTVEPRRSPVWRRFRRCRQTPIRYALAAIKGVAGRRSKTIVAVRDRPFADFGDFARRINARAVKRRVAESLIAAGAFASLERERARRTAAVDIVLATRSARRRRVTGKPNCSAIPSLPSRSDTGRSGLAAGGTAAAGIRRWRIFPHLATRSTTMRAFSTVCRWQSWRPFSRAVKAGVTAARSLRPCVAGGHGDQTATRWVSSGCRNPSANMSGDLAEGLAAISRPSGARQPRLLQMTAEAQGDEVRPAFRPSKP